MKERSLTRQLVTVGWHAGRSVRGGGLRFVALVCGAATLTLAVTALILSAAAYDGREQRSAARNPVVHDSNPSQPAVVLWQPSFDEIGQEQYSVVYMAPLAEGAPLPPGLRTWPRPGQSVLSPALAERGAAHGILTRYGQASGRIAQNGLADPDELLAYVRPADDRFIDREKAFTVNGYGAPGTMFGNSLNVESLRVLATTVLGLLVLPALGLTVVAVRMGAEARRRRTVLLDALGASWSARTLVNAGETLLPAFVGTVLGIVPAFWAAHIEVTLPLTDYTMSRADVAQYTAAWLVAALASFVVVVLAASVLHRVQRDSGTRLRAAGGRLPRWWPTVFPFAVFFTVQGPEPLSNGNTYLFLLIYSAGVALTMATLPSVIGLLIALIGRALGRLGRRTGMSGTLVAGRWMAGNPSITVRLVAGLVIAIGLVGQVQLHSSRLSSEYAAARASADRLNDTVYTLSQPNLSERTRAFLAELPSSVQAYSMTGDTDDQNRTTVSIQASCAALKAIKRSCGNPEPFGVTDPDARLSELANWFSGGTDISLRVGPVAAPSATSGGRYLVLLDTHGKQLPVDRIRQAAFTRLSPTPNAETPGGGWLSGVVTRASRGAWVALFGVAGITATALALSLNSLAEFQRFSRSIAPLGVLTGRRRIFLATAAWTLLLPLLLAAGLGLLANEWLATPLTNPVVGASLSTFVLVSLTITLVVVAFAVWLVGSVSAIRTTDRWKPETD
ncbi:ABC transporter permease [Streptomyces sp. NPDC056987]|uniref:ABC transporter permease n=1 Tax=Streptomyces sp. NPDC056987 TaxID=3345988 RepID=UPI00363CED3E